MTRARDDRKRNMRRQFALTHTDGSPVAGRVIGYQDGCYEAFDSFGVCFAAAVGGIDHEPGSHTRDNWFLSAPYTRERWDDLTYVDDFGWDEP